MRSPVRKYKSLWLGCLFLTLACGPALAAGSGEVTGVQLEPDQRRIVISTKGIVGKSLAHVIGRPNRLVMDFENMTVGKVPRKISGDKREICEIRVGNHRSRARLVVDFHDNPVPAFQIRPVNNQVFVIFGNSLAAYMPKTHHRSSRTISKNSVLSAPLAPDVVAADAKVAGKGRKGSRLAARSTMDAAHKSHSASGANALRQRGNKVDGPWNKSAGESKARDQALKGIKLAQSTELSKPQPPSPSALPSSPPNGAGRPSMRSMPGPARRGPEPRMVREVRPPVTPPTPDPRLIVQQITELKFIQVGHNARLIVRGGDHLDYRLNKVSPTKARLDLVNAEIPKAYQKPLRTDLFSTSVEMIVPGSQTIFMQLKDAVPYQVEKQKGVLMIDFPPPRFSASSARKTLGMGPGAGPAGKRGAGESRETRLQAYRIMREEEVRKENETRRRNIKSLQKQQQELQKQRTEIIKRYQVTPDPEVFNKPVTMDFQGISLKNAFRLLAEQAGINIIVGNDVTGTTTVRLFQVPLGQVIDTILSTNGLDREMIGNVMRIGRKEEMQKYKDQRRKEYEIRIKELDKRLTSLTQEVQKEENASEKALKELEKKEAHPEEHMEDAKTEEYGEAGCVPVKDEKEKQIGEVCFYYATVKLVYADPTNVVNTLDCMFNLQCAGARQAGAVPAGPAATVGTAPPGALPGTSGTTLPTSTPGLPAITLAQQAQRERVVQASESSARAQQRMIGALQAGRVAGRTALPTGTDPMLQTIIVNNMLWPDKPNRMIFIKDTAERIAQMKKVIATLDVPTPQVLIEGRIVEATRDWARGLRVLWGGRNNQVGQIVDGKTTYWGIGGNQLAGIAANTATGQTTAGDNIPSSFAVNLPPTVTGLAQLMGLGMQFGLLGTNYITELDVRLNLGEHNGQTHVIARPKVQVLDNQKASIKKGLSIPFTTTSALGTQTQLVDADLLLEVTPRIFADGRISMNIKMTDNSPDLTTVPGSTSISTQEAGTYMIVKDGETAVIGGILRNTDNTVRDGWPGLMNIPLVNLLFSNKQREKHLVELLVFVSPTIIKRPPPAS